MKFISKRRNASYEGCAFRDFSFATGDIDKIGKLQGSRWYNKDFMELGSREKTPITISNRFGKTATDMNIEELEILLEKKKMDKMVKETNMHANLMNVQVEELPENPIETKDRYSEMSYSELKEEAQIKGMTWDNNPKKVNLLKFIRDNE